MRRFPRDGEKAGATDPAIELLFVSIIYKNISVKLLFIQFSI